MTRKQLLQHLLHQAHSNGFAFKTWYRTAAALPWTTSEEAIDWLSHGARAHLLLFSHSFATAFFQNSGERLRYIQPAHTYQRVGRDGAMQTLQRSAHSRRAKRDDVWRYHLSEMAAAAEPLRYIRRFLLLEETLRLESAPAGTATSTATIIPEEEPHYDEELLIRDHD